MDSNRGGLLRDGLGGGGVSEELKCVHGIEGLTAIRECNVSLFTRMEKALDLLRGTCEYEAGDGYYLSGCGYSHSGSDDPKYWRFCPRCGRRIPESVDGLHG